MEQENKEKIIILDDEDVKKQPLKYSFQNFIKCYVENNGDFIKTAQQLNVKPQQVVKEIFNDTKKRKQFAEAKKIVLAIQTEQLEQNLIKIAKVKDQLGMFFLKTAFPEVYGEKSKRPLTIKFQSKIRGKNQTIDIPDLQEE